MCPLPKSASTTMAEDSFSDSDFLVSILQTAHLWANTGVVFRELSFSRLECGVHDCQVTHLPPVWDILLPLA